VNLFWDKVQKWTRRTDMTLAMFVIGTPLLFQGLKNQLVASVRYVEG
ncbi:unnamed protein product, partial [marine sediment metagenome]